MGLTILGWDQPMHAAIFVNSDGGNSGLVSRFMQFCPRPSTKQFKDIAGIPRLADDPLPVPRSQSAEAQNFLANGVVVQVPV